MSKPKILALTIRFRGIGEEIELTGISDEEIEAALQRVAHRAEIQAGRAPLLLSPRHPSDFPPYTIYKDGVVYQKKNTDEIKKN